MKNKKWVIKYEFKIEGVFNSKEDAEHYANLMNKVNCMYFYVEQLCNCDHITMGYFFNS